MTGAPRAGVAVMSLLLAVTAMGGLGGQEEGLVGHLGMDRIAALAAAADGSVAAFAPSPTAVASFAALVDPVHVRMFLRASRPVELVLAAKIGRTLEVAGNSALSAEFIGVTEDLSAPAALIAASGVTKAPEIVVLWMDVEIARMHPEAGAVIEEDLAFLITLSRARAAEEMLLDNDFFRNVFHADLPLDCTRCH